VCPLRDSCCGTVARFDDQRFQSTFEKVRGCGQPLRAAADHHNRQLSQDLLLASTFIDALMFVDTSMFVNACGMMAP
jgi:hypothetical protein